MISSPHCTRSSDDLPLGILRGKDFPLENLSGSLPNPFRRSTLNERHDLPPCNYFTPTDGQNHSPLRLELLSLPRGTETARMTVASALPPCLRMGCNNPQDRFDDTTRQRATCRDSLSRKARR